MSLWNDRARWSGLCSGESCPICVKKQPLNVVLELETTWLTMQEAAPVVGYVCLVSKVHAVELHDLTKEAAAAFMLDAHKVSKAVAFITRAVKMNYEIHGNSLPHLHMHFFPRYRGDQFEDKPINPKTVRQPVYAPGEFKRIRTAVLLELGKNAG